MNGFCGWARWEAPAEDRLRTLDRMTQRLELWGASDRSTAWGRATAMSVSGPSAGQLIHEQDGYQLVIQGNVRLCGSAAGREGAEPTAQSIVDLYRATGTRMLDSLRGAFALALVAVDGDELLLAVDRIGGECPIYYKSAGRALIFSTRSDSIQAHPLGRSELDPQALLNYLYFNVSPSPRSVRQDVHRLGPAGFLCLRNGSVSVGTYWRVAYKEDPSASLEELTDEFRSLIRSCVKRCADRGPVGCFLSGGTDSSTLAGLLGSVTGSPARTYSIGFDAAGFDEMDYARTAAEAFRTHHHEYYIKPQDVVDAIPSIARAYPEPFGNASAVPTYYCARSAQEDGVRRLLGGDGGDELFAGNQRYADQHLFELYGSVPHSVRWSLETVTGLFPRDTRLAPVRKVASYIRRAKTPMPLRMEGYNIFERDGASAILEPEFLALVDLDEPRNIQAGVYHSAHAATMLNRMLALDLKFTLADNDLPKVSQMCRMAGVDVTFPFLDEEMVEFSCKVPTRLKLKGRKLRWFMKHALRGFLPEKILRKRKHGFGLPFGVWMKQHGPLNAFALDSLESLKKRKVVRPAYIDRVVRLHETEHATYYGAIIWVLMMLEQWFQHHEDPARR